MQFSDLGRPGHESLLVRREVVVPTLLENRLRDRVMQQGLLVPHIGVGLVAATDEVTEKNAAVKLRKGRKLKLVIPPSTNWSLSSSDGPCSEGGQSEGKPDLRPSAFDRNGVVGRSDDVAVSTEASTISTLPPNSKEIFDLVMADANARIHRRLGVCCSTSGGGMMNLAVGIAESYNDSVPVLGVVGQPPSILEGCGAFQDSSGTEAEIDRTSV